MPKMSAVRKTITITPAATAPMVSRVCPPPVIRWRRASCASNRHFSGTSPQRLMFLPPDANLLAGVQSRRIHDHVVCLAQPARDRNTLFDRGACGHLPFNEVSIICNHHQGTAALADQGG